MSMIRLGLQVFDSPSRTTLLADWSHLAQDVEIADGEHGFESLSGFIPMSADESFRWYNRPGLPFVTLNYGAGTVWEGRLEDVARVNGGIRPRALGYWRAMSDVPYTALWSTQKVSGFRANTPDNVAGRNMDRYEYDTNNRLYITPRKDEQFSTANIGSLYYIAPDDQVNDIRAITVTYNFLAGATWKARVNVYDAAWGSGVALLDLNGSGALQTGTTTVTTAVAGKQIVDVLLYYNSGTPTTYAGETGDYYFKITNLTIKKANATITGKSIADALAAYVNSANSSQLSSSTAFVEEPSNDLTEEVYEDQYPADILNYLVTVGDNQTPPRQWETGVWENQRLYFRPRSSQARQWYVDLVGLDVERTLEALRNSAYGVYQDANGRTLRTAVNADDDSVARYGLTRRAAVKAQTSSQTTAETVRDAYLEDYQTVTPRSQLVLSGLFDAVGGRYPLWMARAGDTMTIRNLSPALGGEIDKLRTFRLKHKTYQVNRNLLVPVPEFELPSLEVMVVEPNNKRGRPVL